MQSWTKQKSPEDVCSMHNVAMELIVVGYVASRVVVKGMGICVMLDAG